MVSAWEVKQVFFATLQMYPYFWHSLQGQHYVSNFRRLITHAEEDGPLARVRIERRAKHWELFISYLFK